jgi:hypothetical protein
MKDSEFIELLNLYLDHEITAADAARLEAEVQANPKRREVYQQYCRMQKACTVLAKDFADTTVEAEDRKVVAFETPRASFWSPGFLATGGLVAAAACVAVVLSNRSPAPAPGQPLTTEPAMASTAKVPSAIETAVAPAALEKVSLDRQVVVNQATGIATNKDVVTFAHAVTMPAPRPLQTAVAMNTLALSNSNHGTQGVTLSGLPQQEQELVTQLDWITALKIAPMKQVRAENLRFEVQTAQQTKNALGQGVIERAAFEFQK